MNKIFKNFKNFLADLKYNFSIIYFSDTWLNDLDSCNQGNVLPDYKSIHQIRNHSRRGGVSIYIHKNLSFKIKYDLSIIGKNAESISVEIISNYSAKHFIYRFG